jgi:hypothetical protein
MHASMQLYLPGLLIGSAALTRPALVERRMAYFYTFILPARFIILTASRSTGLPVPRI